MQPGWKSQSVSSVIVSHAVAVPLQDPTDSNVQPTVTHVRATVCVEHAGGRPVHVLRAPTVQPACVHMIVLPLWVLHAAGVPEQVPVPALQPKASAH